MAGALYDVFVHIPNTNAAHGREAAQRMGCGLVVKLIGSLNASDPIGIPFSDVQNDPFLSNIVR